MTVEKLREIYHDKKIPHKAKSEIKTDFMEIFGYATDQQFQLMLKIGSNNQPTPKELKWLYERITYYHTYYSLSVDLTKMDWFKNNEDLIIKSLQISQLT